MERYVPVSVLNVEVQHPVWGGERGQEGGHGGAEDGSGSGRWEWGEATGTGGGMDPLTNNSGYGLKGRTRLHYWVTMTEVIDRRVTGLHWLIGVEGRAMEACRVWRRGRGAIMTPYVPSRTCHFPWSRS